MKSKTHHVQHSIRVTRQLGGTNHRRILPDDEMILIEAMRLMREKQREKRRESEIRQRRYTKESKTSKLLPKEPTLARRTDTSSR